MEKGSVLSLAQTRGGSLAGEALEQTLPFVDLLFCNETEAAAVGEARGEGQRLTTVSIEQFSLGSESGLETGVRGSSVRRRVFWRAYVDLRESVELSKVQIGLETCAELQNETQIAPVVGGRLGD